MKIVRTAQSRGGFAVVAMTASLQAAMMILRRGQSSDAAPSNEHPRCEQWVYVIAGTGRATVIAKGKRRTTVALHPARWWLSTEVRSIKLRVPDGNR